MSSYPVLNVREDSSASLLGGLEHGPFDLARSAAVDKRDGAIWPLMLKRTLSDSDEFLAGDHTVLRELLHPSKHPVNLGYSLAHGKLLPGRRSKRHVLASSEVYYFLEGQGAFTIDGETCSVSAGTMVYVPPGAIQSLENTGVTEVEFLCLVDPAWRLEDETVLEE